jgi:long-chain acyl-CoA synthetase
VVVVGDNRPRLYASMLAVQALGGVPVPLYQDAAAPEYVFPINNAEVGYAIVEDQEQVDKLLEMRAQCPQLKRIWYDDPRGLRNYDEPGLDSLDALMAPARRTTQANPASSTPKSRVPAAGRGGHVLHQRHHRQPQGRGAHPLHLLDRAAAGQAFDKLTARRSAGLHAAGLDRPEHLQLCAVAGLRLRGQLPRIAATVTIDLKEIGPTYYFAPPRIFEGLLTSVMIRMEDAGRIKRGCSTPSWTWPSAWARPAGRQAGGPGIDKLKYALGNLPSTARCATRWAFQPGARGLHRRRGHRPRPVHLLPQHRHQPEAAVRQHRDRGVRVPAARPRSQGRHRGRADRGVEIKLADNGEILVKSPGLLKEYYKNPAATAEVLTADGWYHTGDAGFLDAGGHLKIIDRAKDVGRLQGGTHDGAMFAPKYVENKLKFFPSSRRRWPSATSAKRSAPSSTSTSRPWATGPSGATCPTPATPTWRASPRCWN